MVQNSIMLYERESSTQITKTSNKRKLHVGETKVHSQMAKGKTGGATIKKYPNEENVFSFRIVAVDRFACVVRVS